MAKQFITPEEGEELARLYAELPEAYSRAAAALSTNGRPLEGDLLARFLEEDGKARAIVLRIREIQGIEGQHWMA